MPAVGPFSKEVPPTAAEENFISQKTLAEQPTARLPGYTFARRQRSALLRGSLLRCPLSRCLHRLLGLGLSTKPDLLRQRRSRRRVRGRDHRIVVLQTEHRPIGIRRQIVSCRQMTLHHLLRLAADQTGDLVFAHRTLDRDRRCRLFISRLGRWLPEIGKPFADHGDQVRQIARSDGMMADIGADDLGRQRRDFKDVGRFLLELSH